MRELSREGVVLHATDPQAIENAKRVFDGCEYYLDPYEAGKNCDALVLLTEWLQFRELDWTRIADSMKGKFVFDGRNFLDENILWDAGLHVVGVGR